MPLACGVHERWWFNKLDRIIAIASRDVLDFLEVAVRDVDGHELFARWDKIGDKDGRDVAESSIGRAADRVDDGLELGGEGLVATKLERACEQPVVELVVAEERGRALVDEVLELLLRTKEVMNQTLIMVTHDMTIAERADRIFSMENGVLEPYRKKN